MDEGIHLETLNLIWRKQFNVHFYTNHELFFWDFPFFFIIFCIFMILLVFFVAAYFKVLSHFLI